MSETSRKVIHLSTGCIPILAAITSRNIVLTLLSTITILYVVAELLRLRGHPQPIVTPFTLKMSRIKEKSGFIIRPLYLAIGVILTLALYSTMIAYASIFMVAIGDPIAAVVGGKFGRIHIRGMKTLEGFLAGWIACILVGSVVVSPHVAIIGGSGAMLMELLDFPDDNLTMPVISGLVMTLGMI